MIKSNFINLMLALALPIGMVSGLFVAPWVGCILVMMLGYDIFYKNIKLSALTLSISKIEAIILLYALSSCIWSIEFKTSLGIFLHLALIILLARFILSHENFLDINYKIILGGVIAAICTFWIENFFDGYISQSLRHMTSKPKAFDLSWLDRGCSLLSITTWPMIYMLIKNGQRIIAFLVYILVFTTLFYSDNTAGFIGFFLGTIGYILLIISQMRLALLIKLGIILYIIIMPIASKLEDPRLIAKDYGDVLPISYTHRLLIWNFVATKAMATPILGHGIGTSKFIPIAKEDKFLYKNKELSPLPLHPHNNVLQIFLELGIIGLSLFGLYILQILSKIRNISLKSNDILWGASAQATFINYFFIGMVSFGIWQSWWVMAILFVMVVIKK